MKKTESTETAKTASCQRRESAEKKYHSEVRDRKDLGKTETL